MSIFIVCDMEEEEKFILVIMTAVGLNVNGNRLFDVDRLRDDDRIWLLYGNRDWIRLLHGDHDLKKENEEAKFY